MNIDNDKYFMGIAINEARIALSEGEVPIGACIVCDGNVVSKAHNTRESEKNAIRHAEITAIEYACNKLGGWRLNNCTMYVTLEPCLMCTGALANARIKRLVFAAKDSIGGACGSIINTSIYPSGLKCEITSGICEKEASELLSAFFASRRLNK